MDNVILTKKQLKRARYLANALFGQGRYYKCSGDKDSKMRDYVSEDGTGVRWIETPAGPNFAVTTIVTKGYHELLDDRFDELLTILRLDPRVRDALTGRDPVGALGILPNISPLIEKKPGATLQTDTRDCEVAYPDEVRSETEVVPAHEDCLPEPEPHQDIEDATAVAVEHLNQEAEPPQGTQPAGTEPQPEVHADLAFKTPEVTIQGQIPASVKTIKLEVVVDTINPRAKRDKCATMRLAKEYGLPAETEFAKIVEKFGTDAITRYQDLLGKVPSFGLTEADVRHAFPTEYASLPL